MNIPYSASRKAADPGSGTAHHVTTLPFEQSSDLAGAEF